MKSRRVMSACNPWAGDGDDSQGTRQSDPKSDHEPHSGPTRCCKSAMGLRTRVKGTGLAMTQRGGGVSSPRKAKCAAVAAASRLRGCRGWREVEGAGEEDDADEEEHADAEDAEEEGDAT